MIRNVAILLTIAVVSACSSDATPPNEHDGKAAVPSVPVVEKAGIDLAAIRRIPVQDNLRYQPLETFARVMVRRITGKDRYNKTDPVSLFLHWRFSPEAAVNGRFIKLPSKATANRYGIETPAPMTTHTSLALLARSDTFMNSVMEVRRKKFVEQAQTEPQEDELWGFWVRAATLANVAGTSAMDPDKPAAPLGGILPVIPPVEDPVPAEAYVFLSPEELEKTTWDAERKDAIAVALNGVKEAWHADDGEAFTASSDEFLAAIMAMNPERSTGWVDQEMIDREVFLNKLNPFSHLRFIYFTVFMLALLAVPFKSRVLWGLAVIAAIGAAGFHCWALAERTTISGRAMIGNLYESALFLGAAAMILAVIFELVWRRSWLTIAGSFVAMLMMWWAQSNPEFWRPEISKLQPVLINNSLIHIHVPTIMASYAVLALAVVLGHVYLIMWWKNGTSTDTHRLSELKHIANFMFWTIPVGVILLFAGIVLGGVWADASWGRFWGNDPKEVASAVTFVTFVIVIHGRWAGWLKDMGTALGTLVGGLVLLWTYWGANFIQSGLHSYAGSTADIPTWPLYYAGIEVLFFGISGGLYLARKDIYASNPDMAKKMNTPPDGLMSASK